MTRATSIVLCAASVAATLSIGLSAQAAPRAEVHPAVINQDVTRVIGTLAANYRHYPTPDVEPLESFTLSFDNMKIPGKGAIALLAKVELLLLSDSNPVVLFGVASPGWYGWQGVTLELEGSSATLIAVQCDVSGMAQTGFEVSVDTGSGPGVELQLNASNGLLTFGFNNPTSEPAVISIKNRANEWMWRKCTVYPTE